VLGSVWPVGEGFDVGRPVVGDVGPVGEELTQAARTHMINRPATIPQRGDAILWIDRQEKGFIIGAYR
jgi:hypothetical protein